MPPGRPKIYKTPEEKALANRAKSKRSYHKNKDPFKVSSPRKRPVGSGRPKLYHTPEEKMFANRAKSKRNYHKNKRVLAAVRERKHPKTNPATVTDWTDLVADTSDKFDALLQGATVPKFMAELYRKYSISRRNTTFTDPLLEVEALRATMQRCEAGLLRLSGVDKNFRIAETTGKAIQEALGCLEDLLCTTMDGDSELFEMHRKGELLYQSL
ncbi:hypothetical protein PLEOSDRAFT_1080095 [Pleurotus ostreatus PC15]|uniref:Uncharacterized protein n=1 Tax=Pleurotus ostreatus (strain PC15) TaxID=1137138 RepID=A0A067P6Q7_PLEO1|nr:hypothetical protein PLEOSDRAFT_1082592 [Pleurotus ostreatus PC15]KDQ32510.1 hypothetical protein PLEOSDRAFT_1080095 [Pleurotus ostreatus PC15]